MHEYIGVFNPNISPNSAEGLHFSAFHFYCNYDAKTYSYTNIIMQDVIIIITIQLLARSL